jgi:indole-3-glycerol phosphate synthase
LDFAAALRAQYGVSLIAEVKRASPSKGLIARDWDPELIGETYARAGAAAISVLTDSRFFQGQLEYLAGVKERLREIQRAVPVLRKDFIYHDYQVYEARMAGADALLLIVGVLGAGELARLLELTRQLRMQALVEVHDEAELERALAAHAQIIGINNRNLKTFEVDVETTARLRPRIPDDIVVVAESGIRTMDDVRQMGDLGVDAMLVGEAFCRLPQDERLAKVKEFVAAGKNA